MHTKIAPIGVPRLDNVHQRSFTRDGAASITKIVVSKPRVARGKLNPRFADRAPSLVLENSHRSGVHAHRVGRSRADWILPLERRRNGLSEPEEEFAIEMGVQGTSGYESLEGEK